MNVNLLYLLKMLTNGITKLPKSQIINLNSMENWMKTYGKTKGFGQRNSRRLSLLKGHTPVLGPK